MLHGAMCGFACLFGIRFIVAGGVLAWRVAGRDASLAVKVTSGRFLLCHRVSHRSLLSLFRGIVAYAAFAFRH